MRKEGQLDFVFELYKPFRNQLRNLELMDALYVIWGFARNLTFDLPLPDDIQRPQRFNPRSDKNTRRYRGINDFELEFLYKEMLLHAVPDLPAKHDPKQVDTLAKLVNYMRHNLSNQIDAKYADRDLIMVNFNRTFHQQFKWQQSYTRNAIFRYYKIFAAPEVGHLVQQVYGLTTWELFVLGFFFFRITGDQFKNRHPYPSRFDRLDNEMVTRFFRVFAATIPEIRQEIEQHQQMNENLMYAFNPVTVRPILIHGGYFVCPVPLLLFWQVTSGTYYAIVKEKGFNHAFGAAFENYVGEVIHKVNKGRFIVYPEVTYGKPEKKSVDWLVEEPGCLLFIECKAKRMTLNARTNAGLTEGLTADLHKMADFVLQLYKSLLEYLDGNYPHRPFDPDLTIHLLVLTFEPWYLEYNMDLRQIIRERVMVLFLENDLDPGLLEQYPYQVSSIEEFESDLQIIHEIGIAEYYRLRSTDQLYDIVQ